MKQPSGYILWNMAGVMTNFYDAFEGKTAITEEEAQALFYFMFKDSIAKAKTRAKELDIDYGKLPEWHQFIVADIAYNTGSVSEWTQVFVRTKPNEVLGAARRKQHEIDSRVAKIGYHYGLIRNLDHAHRIGLTEAKYLT